MSWSLIGGGFLGRIRFSFPRRCPAYRGWAQVTEKDQSNAIQVWTLTITPDPHFSGMKTMTETPSRVGPYQLFMLILCVLVLLSLGYEALVEVDPEVQAILFFSDTAVCLVFFGDFLYSLWKSKRRGRYFITWGWIDLVSSIPAVGWVRWGRAARATRILRVLRGVRSVRILGSLILDKRAQSTALATGFITLLAIVFSSIAVLGLEQGMGGAINSGQDALWWAVVTVTTVGYGDLTPVTSGGRLLAVPLMLVGIAIITVVTAFIATWFLEPDDEERDRDLAEIKQELAAIRAAVENRS